MLSPGWSSIWQIAPLESFSFSLSILSSLEGILCCPYLVESDALLSSEQSIYINKLSFFFRGPLSLHSIYLIPYVCVICIYTLQYNPILYYFVSQSNPALQIGSSFRYPLCMPLIYSHHCGLFLIVFYFML